MDKEDKSTPSSGALKIALAALLHDLGKLVSRSHRHREKYEPKEWYAVKKWPHSGVGAYFIKQNIAHFVGMDESVIEFVRNHHDPTTTEERILQLADWLASGERKKDEDLESGKASESRMISIFSRLFNGQGDSYYPARALRLEEEYFPVTDSNTQSDEYEVLTSGLERDLKALNGNHLEQRLLALLEKYLWAVPAQTPTKVGRYLPDISLYDHSRAVAAIATALCLEQVTDDQITTWTSNIEISKYPVDTPFLLVHGDLSGTQDFIKSVPGKGAAKSLKGRSVYLSLLMEILARFLVDRLQLGLANILYTGGGNFFLLAPARKVAELENLRREITEVLLEAHSGEIGLSLGWVPLPISAFFDGQQLKDCFKEASESAGEWKARRFSELGLAARFGEIFTPAIPSSPSQESKVGTCAGCHRTRPIVNEDEHLCAMCESYKDITEVLKTAQFLTLSPCTPVRHKDYNAYSDVFKAFGYEIRFHQEPIKGAINLRLNSTDLSPDWEGFYFLPVALPLREDGKTLKDFDALAKDSEGDDLLGWVKLDVDNLGKIFKNGLTKEKEEGKDYRDYTLSRIITLSRMFSLFFSVHVQKVFEPLYLVYSGGDDTLALGPWNMAWDRLRRLREDFQNYVCNHPRITFSAVFQTLPPKYPVTKALDELEHLLSEAKSADGKNRVSVLGIPLRWFPASGNGDELGEVLEIVRLLEQADEKRRLHLARRLLRLTGAYLPALSRTTRGSVSPSQIWRFAYFLRNESRGTRDALYSKYEELAVANLLNRSTPVSPAVFPVAARLVEMKLRQR